MSIEFRSQYDVDEARRRLREGAEHTRRASMAFRVMREGPAPRHRRYEGPPIDFEELPEFVRRRAVEKGMAW